MSVGKLERRHLKSKRMYRMKFAIVACLLIFSLNQQFASGQEQESAAAGTGPRRFHDIHEDIKAFLKLEATAETDAERIGAIRDLCELFLEIKRDPRLPDQPALLGYKAKVWTRLDRVKKELKRYVKDDAKSQAVKSSTDKQRDHGAEVSRSLSEQLLMINQSSGGPANMVTFASGSWGGGSVADNAAQLIELIQKTIAPETWDVNGGNGAIFFYAPLNALVVRATSEVHFQLGGTAAALRRAAR